MKNVCCDRVEQKSSRGDTEAGGLIHFMLPAQSFVKFYVIIFLSLCSGVIKST